MNPNHSHEPDENTPRNVVPLAPAAEELEKRRRVFFGAAQILLRQLDHDAVKMEESALMDEHSIQRRHELMDTARCLRTTSVWINNLIQPADAPA